MTKIAATGGCFDLINDGHISLLKVCRTIGDEVVVFLNSDNSVRKLKGGCHPILPYEARKAVLMGSRYVDEVISFDDDTPAQVINRFFHRHRLDWEHSTDRFFWIKGAAGYAEKGMKETKVVQKSGGMVLYFDNPVTTHTSQMIERIKAGKSCLEV